MSKAIVPTREEVIEDINDLRALGCEIVQEEGFKVDRAIERLVDVFEDPRVQRFLLEWARQAFMEDCMRQMRLRAFHAADHNESESSSADLRGGSPHRRISDRRATLEYANLLMDQMLRPGLPLKRARKSDLDEKAQELRSQSRGTLKHALYLEKISKRLRPSETVGQQMTEEDLRQLMVLARKEAEIKV